MNETPDATPQSSYARNLKPIREFAMLKSGLTEDERVACLTHPAFHQHCEVCLKFEKYLAIRQILTDWEDSKWRKSDD